MESFRSSPAQSDAVPVLKQQGSGGGVQQRATRLQVWFIGVCTSILLWTCLVQFLAVGRPGLFTDLSVKISRIVVPRPLPNKQTTTITLPPPSPPSPPPPPRPVLYPPPRQYRSNGFLVVSCNGGLNQMRAAIGDMVVASRILNVTLVVPELDKRSFWRDPSNFEDIFDVNHFINSLRDEIRIVRRLPKKFTQKYGYKLHEMAPVSWSNEAYYLQQILPLFNQTKVLHFNKTDARLANNGIRLELQKLRCRVNFHALKFSPVIEGLGYKLVQILQERGPFMALHLRYEMDMLAFSGCTRGCTDEESEKLKNLRYAYPWWREKEIVSEEKRSQGLCPLTPEETALVLQALGFDNGTQIYIAAGEIYGSERRMMALRAAFPRIVRKEKLLTPADLQHFHNHSSQMAALDFMVSVASDTFIPTYDGNMAKVVEGHRRYLGFRKTVLLDRKRLVQLLDMHQNGTLSWDEFAGAVRLAHEKRMGQPVHRVVIPDKPKEEDYFYANPEECFCQDASCYDQLGPSSSSTVL